MLKKEVISKILEVVNKDLNNDKQEDLIDEILSSRCDEIDEMLRGNAYYKDYQEKISVKQDTLQKELSKSNSELGILNDYINVSAESLSYCNELFYKIRTKRWSNNTIISS